MSVETAAPSRLHREGPARAIRAAGAAVARRHVARGARHGARRDRGAAGPAQDARAAALALALRPRRDELRRDDQRVEGAARRPRARLHPGSRRRWWPSRSRSTARANGCCGFPANRRPAAGGRVRLHPARTDRGTLCVSSQVGCTLTCTLLPHRHPAAGAQPRPPARSSARSWSPATARRMAAAGAIGRGRRQSSPTSS